MCPSTFHDPAPPCAASLFDVDKATQLMTCLEMGNIDRKMKQEIIIYRENPIEVPRDIIVNYAQKSPQKKG